MGKYQGYEKYKDSGVEWLGEIPQHWDSITISRLTSKITNGYVGPTRDILVESGIRYIQSLHIKDGKILFDRGHYFVKKEWSDQHQKSKLKLGDILIVQTGDIGQTALVKKEYENCNCHALIIMTPIKEKIDGSFLELFLRSQIGQYFLKCYQTGALHPHLNGTQIKDIKITLPPLDEQQAIAHFLDHKTKQIDDLIAKKEALLEKLDEKRTALISHAVTKGLDPNVPMKDSGIEWLGEIPKHWEVMHLKRKAQVRGGVAKGRKLDKEETLELPYLRVANVQDGYIDISDISYIEVLHNEIERYSLHDGDVLMNEGGDNDKLGRGAVWKAQINPCLHQNHVFSVRPNDKKISSWIALLTSSFYAKFYFFSRAKQSTNLASISSTNIKLFPAIFPPESERQEIRNYISNITTQIDQQKAKIQEAIELFKEYRTALITNAVTGKIDVRQVPIP